MGKTILDLFKGSTFDTAVESDKDTLVEFETTGIRPRSAVELNNPLLYGNQSIRIATRSTSAVEQMKRATGLNQVLVDGGVVGQGLAQITSGGFGRFVFGGQVSSLSQARDGINTRLGIPQLTIPTYVKNTGELQRNIEPDTMITIARIKNDAAGTLLGQFLKQSGGGNPQTIGKQLLGQGISLVKDKVRDFFFGDPYSLGANTAQPANGAYEYSSQFSYSDKIRVARERAQQQKDLAPLLEATNDFLIKASLEKERLKRKLGAEAVEIKNKLKGTSNASKDALDKAVEEQTRNPKPNPDFKYSETLGNYREDYREANTPIIDLSLVSPVFGVDRKDNGGRYGKTEYGFSDRKNNTGVYSPYNPTEGNTYGVLSGKKNTWKTVYGLDNSFDLINQSPAKIRSAEELSEMEGKDLIPLWFKSLRDSKTVHFRSYITGLSESTTPSWESSNFFGNPYKFYTYTGVERSVQFVLNVVCFNKLELAANWEKLQFLTQQTYPSFATVDGKNYVQPPIITFRLGNIYLNKTGFIDSLSYSIPDNNSWETNSVGLLLPRYIEVSMTIKFIEDRSSGIALYNFSLSDEAVNKINESVTNGATPVATEPVQNTDSPNTTTPTPTSTTSTPAVPARTTINASPFQNDAIATQARADALAATGNFGKNLKIDKNGNAVTPPREAGVNKPQTNLETGKTESTPQQDQGGTITTSDAFTSEFLANLDQRFTEAKKVFPFVDDDVLLSYWADPTYDINSVKKISETNYSHLVVVPSKHKGTLSVTYTQFITVYSDQITVVNYPNAVATRLNGVDVNKELPKPTSSVTKSSPKTNKTTSENILQTQKRGSQVAGTKNAGKVNVAPSTFKGFGGGSFGGGGAGGSW
jgi:hypothetical protein